MDEAEYMEIKERAVPALLALPGVHAVGVGGKLTADEPTGELAIMVFVEDKRPLAEIPEAERIPAEIEGVKTDVVQMPAPMTFAGVDGAIPGSDLNDDNHYSSLRGGTQTMAVGRTEAGTLGCMFTVENEPKTVLAITNHHVLYGSCSSTPNHEEVGHPDNETSSSDCCSHIIGTVLDARCDELMDIALVKLKPGIKWMAQVEEIGVVSGTHPVTLAEAGTHQFQVVKRGCTTGKTGGTVLALGVHGEMFMPDPNDPTKKIKHRDYNGALSVRPNTNQAHPGVQTQFASHGDSGSAVLSAQREVIGILFGGVSTTEGPLEQRGSGLVIPIQTVIKKFSEEVLPRIKLQVATAQHENEVRVVPTAMVADAAPARDPLEIGQQVDEELRETVRGRRYSDLFRRHREEVGALVHHNRRVTLAWHRSGAAELFQTIVAAFRTSEVRVPAEIGGRPIRACLDDVVAALRRAGSAGLRADLDRLLPTLPDVAGRTDREIVELLKGPEARAAPSEV